MPDIVKTKNEALCLSNPRYREDLEWIRKSYLAAIKGEPVPCRGCEKQFHLTRVFRCYHCGSYFCPACAREHFGDRPSLILSALKEKTKVICNDWDCQSRDDCPHSTPHHQIGECTYVCGADEPCSRCLPVEEVTHE